MWSSAVLLASKLQPKPDVTRWELFSCGVKNELKVQFHIETQFKCGHKLHA